MNSTITKNNVLLHTLLLDAAVLGLVCLIPAVSHVFAVPFYRFNPMFLCLLVGLLFSRDWRNALLLAVLLPLFSMLVTGMPTPLKAMCMAPELLTFVAVYQLLAKRMPVFFGVVAAALAGKVVFYLLKVLLIAPEHLLGTSLWLQLAVVVAYAALFALGTRLMEKRER